MNNSTRVIPMNLTCREDIDMYSATYISTVVCLSAINVIAFCTNLFLIMAIFSVSKLREKLASLFIANLCILDLLASVTIMPKSIAVFISQYWLWNHQMCVANGFLNTFISLASIIAICCVSVERYYCIRLPMHHAGNMTLGKTGICLIATWAIPILVSSLPVVGWGRYGYSTTSCHCTYVHDGAGSRVLIVAVCLVFFAVPAVMLGYLNFGIYKVARQAAIQVQPAPAMNNLLPPGCAPDTNGISEEMTPVQRFSDPGVVASTHDRKMSHTNTGQHTLHTISSKQSISQIRGVSIDSSIRQCVMLEVNSESCAPNTVTTEQTVIFQSGMNVHRNTTSRGHGVSVTEIGHAQFMTSDITRPTIFISSNGHNINIKAIVTLLTTFTLFLIFWGPYFIVQFVNAMTKTEDRTETTNHVILWLSYVSYAGNPYIYGLLNKTLRKESKIFLKKIFCKNNTERNSMGRQPGVDDVVPANGAEDFFQFLERTSSATNIRKF